MSTSLDRRMNNTSRVAELKRQIAEQNAATARLEQELRQLASQERLNHGRLDSSKLSARSQSTAGYAMAKPMMVHPLLPECHSAYLLTRTSFSPRHHLMIELPSDRGEPCLSRQPNR